VLRSLREETRHGSICGNAATSCARHAHVQSTCGDIVCGMFPLYAIRRIERHRYTVSATRLIFVDYLRSNGPVPSLNTQEAVQSHVRYIEKGPRLSGVRCNQEPLSLILCGAMFHHDSHMGIIKSDQRERVGILRNLFGILASRYFGPTVPAIGSEQKGRVCSNQPVFHIGEGNLQNCVFSRGMRNPSISSILGRKKQPSRARSVPEPVIRKSNIQDHTTAGLLVLNEPVFTTI